MPAFLSLNLATTSMFMKSFFPEVVNEMIDAMQQRGTDNFPQTRIVDKSMLFLATLTARLSKVEKSTKLGSLYYFSEKKVEHWSMSR